MNFWKTPDQTGLPLAQSLRCGLRSAVTVAVLVVAAFDVTAIEFSWAPQAKVMTRADDNVRGAARSPETAWGFDTGASVNFLAQTDQIVSELIPRVNARRFVVGDNLDADEYSVTFNNKLKLEQLVSTVNFTYARDSTLITTEAADTGLRNDVTNRDTITVAPSLYYAVDDRLTAHCNFLVSDVKYSDSGTSGLVGYKYLQGGSGIQYLLTDRIEPFFTVTISEFDAPTVKSSTRTYGAQAGTVFHWDSTLDLTASLGWNVNKIDFTTTEPVLVVTPVPHIEQVERPDSAWTNGPNAMVSVQKTFERSNLRFDYSRAVSPSGRGSQSNSDRLDASVSHKFSERLSLLVAALYEMRSSQAENIPGLLSSQDLNRDYTEARTSLRYQICDEWTTAISFRYGYRKSNGSATRETAHANAVYLSLDYNGMRKSFGVE